MEINRQYIGARYVPKFYDGSNGTEWDENHIYDPLTIVTYLNNSYTSKKSVPASIGDPMHNPLYWVATGNYNAQVEAYRNEVLNYAEQVTTHYVMPEDFGAVGDGINDDTDALEDAIATGKRVLLTQTYLVSRRLYPINNMYGTPNSLIKVASTAFINPLKIETDNVVLDGINIEGNRLTYAETPEHYTSHGIWIESDNVRVQHCKVTNCMGDGIYFGGAHTCINTVVDGCLVDNCMRNGLSIISAKQFKVTNCLFSNINGAAPQCGIDIEPNSTTEDIQGVINGCSTVGCYRSGMQIGLYHIGDDKQIELLIDNHMSINDGSYASDDSASAIVVQDYISGTGKANVVIRNTIIENPITRGLYIRNLGDSNGCIVDAELNVTKCTLNEACSLYLKTSVEGENVYNKLKIHCDPTYTGYSFIARRQSSVENRGYTIEIDSNKMCANNTHANPRVYFNNKIASPLAMFKVVNGTATKNISDMTLTHTATGEYQIATTEVYTDFFIGVSSSVSYKYTIAKTSDTTYLITFKDDSDNNVDNPNFSVTAYFSVRSS